MLVSSLNWTVAALAAALVMCSAAPDLAAHTVTVETLRQLVASFNSHDLDRVMNCFAPARPFKHAIV